MNHYVIHSKRKSCRSFVCRLIQCLAVHLSRPCQFWSNPDATIRIKLSFSWSRDSLILWPCWEQPLTYDMHTIHLERSLESSQELSSHLWRLHGERQSAEFHWTWTPSSGVEQEPRKSKIGVNKSIFGSSSEYNGKSQTFVNITGAQALVSNVCIISPPLAKFNRVDFGEMPALFSSTLSPSSLTISSICLSNVSKLS